jgi:hypothetical protein
LTRRSTNRLSLKIHPPCRPAGRQAAGRRVRGVRAAGVRHPRLGSGHLRAPPPLGLRAGAAAHGRAAAGGGAPRARGHARGHLRHRRLAVRAPAAAAAAAWHRPQYCHRQRVAEQLRATACCARWRGGWLLIMRWRGGAGGWRPPRRCVVRGTPRSEGIPSTSSTTRGSGTAGWKSRCVRSSRSRSSAGAASGPRRRWRANRPSLLPSRGDRSEPIRGSPLTVGSVKNTFHC